MQQTLIGLQKKMEQQIEDRELSLISQIELDDDEIELIRANGREMHEDVEVGWRRCDLQFAYYLVDIGMRFYDDRKYWSEFWNSIGCKQNVNKQKAIGDYFMRTLERYKLAAFDLGGMPYVGNILAHGFIPNKYSSAFFDFLYNFYNVALRGTVPEDLDDAMYIIAQVFSDPKFAQTYPELRGTNLIKSTCNVLCDETLFGDVVKKMIRRIGNSYESLEDVRLGIYEEQFRNWAENRDHRKTRDRVGSPPYIECNKERMEFNLVIPPRIVETRSPLLTLKSSSGDILYKRRLYTTERFGSLVMDDEASVNLPDPLDEFTAWIDCDHIFSNTNDGYILFNKNGKSHRKVSLGFNLVLARGDLPLDSENLKSLGSADDKGELYGFMMGPTDSIQIGGRSFTVEKTIDESIRIMTLVVNAQCRDQDGNAYLLFDRLPSLHIFINRENRNLSLDVTCGMNRTHIERLGSLYDNGLRDSDIELDLASTGLESEAGVYSIMLNGTVKAKFLMIPGFKCTFEESTYTAQKESTCKVTGFDRTYRFNTMDGTVCTEPMILDSREFTFSFQIPSYRYRIDDQPWRMFGDEMYYREAQGTKLFIYAPTPLFPRINAKGFEKRFELDIEGEYLIFDFEKIAKIDDIMRYSNKRKSMIGLYCGNRELFRIRYTADYTISDCCIVRKNGPQDTYATVENASSHEERPFDGGRYEIEDGDDDLIVWEYYETDFGSEKREACCLKRSVSVDHSFEPAIVSGEFEGVILFEIEGKREQYDSRFFRNLMSLEGTYDPDTDLQKFYKGNPSPREASNYAKAYNAVLRVLPHDPNINRLKARIKRFALKEPRLAIQLCDSYLNKTYNEDVANLKAELESESSENTTAATSKD